MEFNPMRSYIFLDVVKEDYRHKLQNWLYKTHVPESIAQFEPYVTKYCFYSALPVPPDGERFGTYNFQLTEHYWLVNPMTPELDIKTISETVSPEPLIWQGIIPENGPSDLTPDQVRSAEGTDELPPFIFAFLPFNWEVDLKGGRRSQSDGANYRWLFLVKYPDAAPEEEADRWMMDEVLVAFAEMDEVTRILTSKVLREVNGCGYYRAVELWTDCPSKWHIVAVEKTGAIRKPEWASVDRFPYLKPKFEIASLFLSDVATSNNLQQYRGFYSRR